MLIKITAILDLPKLDEKKAKGVKITNKNIAEMVYQTYSYASLGKALAAQLQSEDNKDDYTTVIKLIRSNPKIDTDESED